MPDKPNNPDRSEEKEVASDALEIREAAWRARHANEQATWSLQQRLEKDARQQIEALERGLAEIADRFAQEMGEKQSALLRELRDTTDLTLRRIEEKTADLAASVERAGRRQEARLRQAAAAEPAPPVPTEPGKRWPWLARIVPAATLAAGVALGMWLNGAPSVEPPAPSPPPVVDDTAETPRSEPSPPESSPVPDGDRIRNDLTDLFRRPETATALLRELEGQPGLEDWVAASRLALGLRHPHFDDATSCALLQQVLDVTVDGDCGPGTKRQLALSAEAAECLADGWKEQAICKLQAHLDLPVTGQCPLELPVDRPCGWSLGEARRLLDLVRATAQSTTNDEVRSTLEAVLAPDLEIVEVPESGARLLIELSFLEVATPPTPKAFSDLSDEELAAVWERRAAAAAPEVP